MPIGIQRNIASCCMCFTIRTGCKIIGMLSLFFSAMHFMIYTMMFIQVESNLPRCINMLEKDETQHKALLNNCFQHSIWLVRAALLLGCLLYLFGLIGSSMLLKGISQRAPKLFYVWFLFCTVIIVRNLMSYGTFHDVNEGMKNLLFCLILLYFFCIVKFHERELISGVDDLMLGALGNASMQEVVTTYPGDPNLPKDNPPPYSVVVDSPPPYSACAIYLPESQCSDSPSPLPPVTVTAESTTSDEAVAQSATGDVAAAITAAADTVELPITDSTDQTPSKEGTEQGVAVSETEESLAPREQTAIVVVSDSNTGKAESSPRGDPES